MLTFQGRQILDTLPEIVHPDHTVVMVHDMQNDNTGKGGKYDAIGRRIDVTPIIPPIGVGRPALDRPARARLHQRRRCEPHGVHSAPPSRTSASRR